MSRILSLLVVIVVSLCLNTRGHALVLKPFTNDQVVRDLHALKDLIQDYYGPLQMKEKNGNFKLDQLISDSEKEIHAAKSEAEALGALARTLGKLNDGHVSITFPDYSSHPNEVKLPIFLTPIEGKAIVGFVEKSAKNIGIEVGDEVTSVDGVNPMDFVQIASKYHSFGNPGSNAHLVYRATRRPFYMTEITPQKPEAHLEVKKANGKTYPFSLIWRPQSIHDKKILFVEPQEIDTVPSGNSGSLGLETIASLYSMESTEPFFITDQNKAQFKISRVHADDETLQRFGVLPKLEETNESIRAFNDAKANVPDIFAAMYTFENKNILLVRQPTYRTNDYRLRVQTYKAILSQFEPFVEVVVIDQTHNGGGESYYVEAFFRLFIQDKAASVVQFMRADRKWVRRLEALAKNQDPDLESETSRQTLLRASMVENANFRGDFLIPTPIPLNQDPEVYPDPEYQWKKPVLVLTDELAGSCADIFPLLMRKAGFKTFGQPTMGLGGNVEPVGELPHSQASVSLTRGLYVLYNPLEKYSEDDFIENKRVPVDYTYSHTLEDFRAGFVKYVEEFSKAALQQVK